jgi:hypothetical protein
VPAPIQKIVLAQNVREHQHIQRILKHITCWQEATFKQRCMVHKSSQFNLSAERQFRDKAAVLKVSAFFTSNC